VAVAAPVYSGPESRQDPLQLTALPPCSCFRVGKGWAGEKDEKGRGMVQCLLLVYKLGNRKRKGRGEEKGR